MSNLANNHNKVSSSHYAQSAGNEKETFYFIYLDNDLYETCEIHYVLVLQEQLDFAQKNCTFKHDPRLTLFRALKVKSVHLWFRI